MNSSLRLGIDVGGTNTDAVVVDGAGAVLATIKVPTTPEPLDGIRSAIATSHRAASFDGPLGGATARFADRHGECPRVSLQRVARASARTARNRTSPPVVDPVRVVGSSQTSH